MKKLAAALVGLTLCASAQAEFMTGNTLYGKMTGDSGDQIQALGYVQGVFDAAQGAIHCAPRGPGITSGQIYDMVKKFMELSPDKRHHTADAIIGVVLKTAWPCQNSSRNTL